MHRPAREASSHGAVAPVHPLADPVPGAAAQPPRDLGWGPGVRTGAGPPGWRPSVPAAQQPAAPSHQPAGGQPASPDVPGETATDGPAPGWVVGGIPGWYPGACCSAPLGQPCRAEDAPPPRGLAQGTGDMGVVTLGDTGVAHPRLTGMGS